MGGIIMFETNHSYHGSSGETDGYGNGLCYKHGYCASIDSSGDLWCPHCGWVGQVEVDQLNNYEFKIATGKNKYEI